MSCFRPNMQSMSGYVPGEQPQGGGVIKLNTNEKPYPPSPAVAAAVNEVLQRPAKVSRPDGRRAPLRGERSARRRRVDPGWQRQRRHPHDRHPRAGRRRATAADGLSRLHLYRTLARTARRGREEVFFEPDWSLPATFAEARDGLRLAVLANPNSPSGTVVPPDRVAELAEQLPCPLLVDQAYADFAETNCLHLVAKNERIMVSRTLSKSYALAGLRFGYLVAQPQLIEQFVKAKDSYNCDALSIAAAAAAIGDRPMAHGQSGEDPTHPRAADDGFAEFRVYRACNRKLTLFGQVHSRRDVRAMYEEFKCRKNSRPIHGISPLERRPADQRRHGRRVEKCVAALQEIVIGSDPRASGAGPGGEGARCCRTCWAGESLPCNPLSHSHKGRRRVSMTRTATIQRKTAETDIRLESISTAAAGRKLPPASASSTTCSRCWPNMRRST